MSQRAGECGAFDALVHAIVGLGAGSSWYGLPPATAPASLARALGQGVLQGRRPRGANGAYAGNAGPQPVEVIAHEAQRSVAELATVLWHALDGPGEAPELARWMTPPHTDPTIALSLSRRRLAEYAVPEAIDRSFAFPGTRVWLIEIERAKGDTPAGIAVWRSRGAGEEWRTRCACVWTHGRIGSATRPLIIGAQWGADGANASASTCVIGPSWVDASRTATDASRSAAIARRQNAIGKRMMARIAIPAALAWLDEHGGNARPGGRFGAEERTNAEHRPRIVHPVRAPGRAPAPAWLGVAPERAVEAIVLRTAGEGWRVGASCAVPEWRDGWAGYAKLGAVAWAAIDDLDRRVDSDTWTAMERALREGRLDEASAHPGIEATSALVRKLLEQTGRSHVARAPDPRMLCALEIPARLWRALRDAGPCPEPSPRPDLNRRWWLVEIEPPADDEPNAVALWEEDGSEVALAAFLEVEDGHNPPCLTVVTWRTGADGEPAPVGPYRPSTADAAPARQGPAATRPPPTTLFALKRALGPEREEHLATGRRGHRHGGGRRLLALQEVGPHWKRQAHGLRHSKRRWQLIERYERGPAPEDDQIVLIRLAERQGGVRAPERPTARGRRKAVRRRHRGR